MDLTTFAADVRAWIAFNSARLAVSLGLIAGYFILNWLIARIARAAAHDKSRQGAAYKASRAVRLVTAFFGLMVLLVVWGIDFGAVSIFATTTVTLLGVALFASWSLLSNVTAYFVLLFHRTFTRGTYVRIIDADNYVEGYVSDLSLFSMELRTESGEIIVYPNNLLISRVALINPDRRQASMGKIVNPPEPPPAKPVVREQGE